MITKKLSILHLSAVLTRGGGEHHIIDLTQELKKLGHNCFIFCPAKSSLESDGINNNLNIITANLRFKVDPFFIAKLVRFCTRNKVDIVHVHDPIAMQIAILASFYKNFPKTVLSKKTSFPIKKRKSTLFKYNHILFEKIIGVSKEVSRITAQSITKTSKITTIYNGCNIDTLSKMKQSFDIKAMLRLPLESKIVLNIANHTKPKNLSSLIRCANALKSDDEIYFVQIGRYTEQTSSILDLVTELNLNSKIYFLGEQENAAVYLRQADICLITSKSEGLPQVIFESMYFKTPIISTSVGGIPEIIQDNKNGYLFEIEDYQGMANRIVEITANPDKVKLMLDYNKNLIIDKFNSRNMAIKTVNLYNEVLKV